MRIYPLYRNLLRIWNLGLAKAPGLDLPKKGLYDHLVPFLEVKSRELSLRSKTKFLIGFSIIILSALALAGCGSKQEAKPKEAAAVPVLTTSTSVKDVPVCLESLGTLRPSIFAEVRPQVSGALAEILVREGEQVSSGTPLFKIEEKAYQIRVQEAEAQLAMARASAEESFKKLQRYESLAKKDLVSQAEWDHLEAEAAKAKATLQADEARLLSAKLDLERCTLCAPIGGRLGRIDAYPGLLLSAGQPTPLSTLSKMDPLIVEFTVTEKEYPKLPEVLPEIEVTALTNPENPVKGKATFFDSRFDDKSGLLLIRGMIPNPELSLRPGQSVKVRLPIDTTREAKLIPQKAVKYNQQGPYVYIVQPDSTVAFRQIKLGDSAGQDIIVLEGLEPSDPIITDGHMRLYPGLKVEIK